MTVEEAKEDAATFNFKASIAQIIEEMYQKADSLIAEIDDFTTNHLGMAIRAERKWRSKDLQFFADKIKKAIEERRLTMPIYKNLFDEYFEAKRKCDLVKDELFSQIREICEVCTNISPRERITDIQTEDEDPIYLDEPEVYVGVTSYDYGDETYHFPKRYLDMTLDEIKADVERMKKLEEEKEHRAKADAEYKQYLRLKEKFEKTKED